MELVTIPCGDVDSDSGERGEWAYDVLSSIHKLARAKFENDEIHADASRIAIPYPDENFHKQERITVRLCPSSR